jgi:hypothetical protein
LSLGAALFMPVQTFCERRSLQRSLYTRVATKHWGYLGLVQTPHSPQSVEVRRLGLGSEGLDCCSACTGSMLLGLHHRMFMKQVRMSQHERN